jgi:hypothetical protein
MAPPKKSSSAESLDSTLLPSPVSSVKSSAKNSRKGSPNTQSTAKRRKSARLVVADNSGSTVDNTPATTINPEVSQDQRANFSGQSQAKVGPKKIEINESRPWSTIKQFFTGGNPLRSQLKPGQPKPVQPKPQTFVEPQPDEPVPSVTGLPLGAPPSIKIRKERLWPTKGGKRGRPKKNPVATSDEANTTTPELDKFKAVDTKYKASLKTKINEELQKPSSIRSSTNLKPVPKKGSEIYQKTNKMKRSSTNDVSPPSTPKKQKTEAQEKEENKQRKIKNASPKKARRNAFGFETQVDFTEKRESAPDFADTTKDNDDFCSACGEPGIFLCCESCPRSFHFACCDPPFHEDNLPNAEWFCNECSSRKSPPVEIHTGLFGKLLDQIPYRNPIQYHLPKKIRDRFEGVVTGTYGEYEDSDYKSFNPSQVYAFDQTDPALHFDKDNNPLICIKCGESGISPNKVNGEFDKLIIQCEYCPSAWHLDCLTPPLSTVKQLGKKWKCPNHADHLLPGRPRKLKRPNVIEVDQSRGYKNNGVIEIKSDEESSNDSEEESEEEEVEIREIPTPPYMKSYDTKDGVGAQLPAKTVKQWTDAYSIPKIPQKGIVLDFIGKCVDSKMIEREKIDEIYRLSKENNALLANLDQGYNAREKGTIKSLIGLKELDFEKLVEVADKELKLQNGELDHVDKLENNEIEELLHIKKLMLLKGKKKLLAFLNR